MIYLISVMFDASSIVAERNLLDTDIIIDYLRGSASAVKYVEGLSEDLLLSAVTVAELWSGVKGEEEERTLDHFLLAFKIIPIDGNIAKRGGILRREYKPGHGTGLADALIAATAEQEEARLVTFNVRHYPMLGDVHAPNQK